MTRAWVSAVALTLLGCAARASEGQPRTVPSQPLGADSPPQVETTSAEPSAAEPAGPTSAGAPDADGYLGVIDRAGLNALVDRGLGAMLARLQLTPVLVGKRFVGFRVTALDPQWSAAGLQEGDIIERLNGQPIERPEQALVAFESLRVASEVAVRLQRAGKTELLRYRIE